MHSTHTAQLPFPQLPLQARQVHLFPALGDTSLISVGTLLDAGCKAAFEDNTCTISYQQEPILQATLDLSTKGLWLATLPAMTMSLTPMEQARSATVLSIMIVIPVAATATVPSGVIVIPVVAPVVATATVPNSAIVMPLATAPFDGIHPVPTASATVPSHAIVIPVAATAPFDGVQPAHIQWAFTPNVPYRQQHRSALAVHQEHHRQQHRLHHRCRHQPLSSYPRGGPPTWAPLGISHC
jgi:hypothetical protein